MTVNIISMHFFYDNTATTDIYTLSLHDALPICLGHHLQVERGFLGGHRLGFDLGDLARQRLPGFGDGGDRKSTRLNSSHRTISYAVFCLKKKSAITSTRRIKIMKTLHHVILVLD